MRIINELEFKYALTDTLDIYGNANRKYLDWVKNSALKWLLRNNPNFVQTFCTPIYQQTIGMFRTAAKPGGQETWYFKDINGQPQRVFLENEFDKKDALNNQLFYFLPRQTLSHWLYSENKIFIEARDFFDDLLEEKPDENLSKYTLETLPAQILRWRAVQDARRLRERQEEQRRLENEVATREQVERARVEASGYITEAMASSDEALKLLNLKLAWGKLTEGQDYSLLGRTYNMSVLLLLSNRSLDYEAAFKGSCIAGSSYKNKLNDGKTLFLSTRHLDDTSDAVYTAEVYFNGKDFTIMQIEHWGYKSYKQSNPASHRAEVKKSLEAMLPKLDKTLLFPPSKVKSGLTYTINRSI